MLHIGSIEMVVFKLFNGLLVHIEFKDFAHLDSYVVLLLEEDLELFIVLNDLVSPSFQEIQEGACVLRVAGLVRNYAF